MKYIFGISLLVFGILNVGCSSSGAGQQALVDNQEEPMEDIQVPTQPDSDLDGETGPTTFLTSQGSDIILDNLQNMTLISSPLTVRGRVPSSRIFEGIFPITIMTAQGEVVKERYGEATIFDQSGELIDGLVPFTAVIEFTPPSAQQAETGKIRFAADGTGLEEGEEQDLVEVQVLFE